ncbi:MAG TPA: KH domain-containing protein [archaeon]|nr:KH domain-containing protein [archaeon]
MFSVSIPEERRPILIGKNGATKRFIEKKTNTRIKVGLDIEIEGENELLTGEIVKAIGRGFSPHRALRLTDSNCLLDVIQIKGTTNKIKRLMSRVIGRYGNSRRIIEESTGAFVSVYGRTISIIGTYKEAEHARKAIEMLLTGSKHTTVYKYLSKLELE